MAAEPDLMAELDAAEDIVMGRADPDAARLLLAAQRAEWSCHRCQVIHPWRPGDFLSVACPDCGQPMTPTSPALRDLEHARTRLAVLDELLPVFRDALKVANAEALYPHQRRYYQAALDKLDQLDSTTK